MASFYSYLYVDPIHNQPFYVGKGKGDRAYVHLKKSRNNFVNNKINKIRKLGYEPLVGLIRTSTEKYAFMLEQGLIKLLGRKDNGTGVLCNLTDGGEGTVNINVSDEHKQKISASMKGVLLGRPISEEHRQRIKKTKSLKKTGTGKWMNNGEVQKKVPLSDVEKFIADGWKLGIIGKFMDEQYRLNMRQKTAEQWKAVKATGHTGHLTKINEVRL